MKILNFKLFVFVLLISSACQNSDTSQSELATKEAELLEIAGNYGEELSESEMISMTQLISEVEANGSFEAKIIGEINEVCSSKGCWLTMDLPNGESMRVTFKDYGFFVPKNSQGFPIILEGVATLTETDVETLRHFAEDQGKSKEEIEAITESKREITFEANGVIINNKIS